MRFFLIENDILIVHSKGSKTIHKTKTGIDMSGIARLGNDYMSSIFTPSLILIY